MRSTEKKDLRKILPGEIYAPPVEYILVLRSLLSKYVRRTMHELQEPVN